MRDQSQTAESSDEGLVLAALTGDTSSFGTLVERYWSLSVALGLSRIGDAAEAEDIAQESFLKAYSHLHQLRDPARFAGWLSRIVSQQCTDTARKHSRRRRVLGDRVAPQESLDALPAYSGNPGLTETQSEFVRRTVGQLPEKLRVPIIMRFTAGLSATQIARQLNRRPGTIRTWLCRAYKILRKDLAPLLEEVGP
jgi:RNA polymerase sigma-70 factor (ECF subfamily)